MALGQINSWKLNTERLNNGSDRSLDSFLSEMRRKRDATPLLKVELIEVDGTVHDISQYYVEGANFEQVKERAPDEIQAGNFDLVLNNSNNTFSEYVSGSLLEGMQYHGAKIKIYVGFRLPNGTEVYEDQAEGLIDDLICSTDSKATFRCRDRISYIIDATLHRRPTEESPVYDVDNIGNGTRGTLETKPFSTITENWTLTCTTGGASGTAEFSVVGSVSGNIGTAVVGTEFVNNVAGVKFTINSGTVDWALNDVITFSTKKYPEWSEENPGKIIWAILTGYNFDSDTAEGWSEFVLNLDHTKSDANADIDYNSFVTAIAELESVDPLKGYVPYNTQAKDFIEGLLILFLGSIYTGKDGRIKIKPNVPTLGSETNPRSFEDSEKVVNISYVRSAIEIINHVVGRFKLFDNWEFSDVTPILDGTVVEIDSDSIAAYKKTITKEINSLWYTTNGSHIETVAQRLINKYANPPLNIDFITGLDALRTEIGDVVNITDDKFGFSNETCEVSRVTTMLDEIPKKMSMRVRRDADFAHLFGFWGSSANELDGISPQNSDWDSASASDKQFAYLSQTGGGGP